MKYFNKTTKNMTLTQKFDYIKQHFTYEGRIGNNIKLYKLPLTIEQRNRAFEIICDENLYEELWGYYLDSYFNDFKRTHADCYEIYTDGRSGGYFVLWSKTNQIIDEYMEQTITYRDYVATLHNAYGDSYIDAQKEARQEIEDTFDLIVDFDNTCDDMLNEFIYVLDCVDIKTKTYTKEYTCKTFGDNED